MSWPVMPEALVQHQSWLGGLEPDSWRPGAWFEAGGCFVCFGRGGSGPGAAGDRGWAAAVGHRDGRWVAGFSSGPAGAPYEAGLLALREGALLEAAFRALPVAPDVLLVNATGRDHPRRAGLALHLGHVLGIPTVGVTHRTLLAAGEWPPDETGASSPLQLAGEEVGAWVRTRRGTRPLAVHAAWRTDAATAVEVVLGVGGDRRTPEPLRLARRAARAARAGDLAPITPGDSGR